MAIHFTFKLFFPVQECLTGHGGKNIQQVRDTAFFHIITHYRRTVGVSDRTFDFHYRFRLSSRPIHVITVIVRFGHFLVGSSSDITRAPDFGINGSGTFENIAIQPAETLGDIASSVPDAASDLRLPAPEIGLVQQDARRHQHRVIKQAGVNVFP